MWYEVLAEKQQSAFHDGITVLVSCTVKLVLEQLAVFLTLKIGHYSMGYGGWIIHKHGYYIDDSGLEAALSWRGTDQACIDRC